MLQAAAKLHTAPLEALVHSGQLKRLLAVYILLWRGPCLVPCENEFEAVVLLRDQPEPSFFLTPGQARPLALGFLCSRLRHLNQLHG